MSSATTTSGTPALDPNGVFATQSNSILGVNAAVLLFFVFLITIVVGVVYVSSLKYKNNKHSREEDSDSE